MVIRFFSQSETHREFSNFAPFGILPVYLKDCARSESQVGGTWRLRTNGSALYADAIEPPQSIAAVRGRPRSSSMH